jgi:hypothetical protein
LLEGGKSIAGLGAGELIKGRKREEGVEEAEAEEG